MDQQQWTRTVGLKRTFWHLVIRSVIALVLWAGCVWLVTPVLNWSVTHWLLYGMIPFMSIAPGAAIGYGLWRKLTDIAGMTGLPIAAMAIIFGLGVVIGGVILANSLRPLQEGLYLFLMVATGLWVIVFIIKRALVHD